MWEIFNRKREALNLKEKAGATAQIVAEISQERLGGNFEYAIHYGSTAYGKPGIASDIDVLVITTKQVEKPHQVTQELVRLSEESGAPHGLLHLVLVTEEEFTAYPSIHPAIAAAFWRGKRVPLPKVQTST